jgi:hypothetical protein
VKHLYVGLLQFPFTPIHSKDVNHSEVKAHHSPRATIICLLSPLGCQFHETRDHFNFDSCCISAPHMLTIHGRISTNNI